MEPGAGAAREGAESCLERLKHSLPGPADLAGAASTLERILRESVCQLQGWLRVYGEERGKEGGRETQTPPRPLPRPFCPPPSHQ